MRQYIDLKTALDKFWNKNPEDYKIYNSKTHIEKIKHIRKLSGFSFTIANIVEYMYESKYGYWIHKNYPNKRLSYGKCETATENIIKVFPELNRVRGHFEDPIYGRKEHWWCKDPDGKIIDPTIKQFTFISFDQYEEWDETQPEPTGMCPNCGDYSYEGNTCCSERCHNQYANYVLIY